MRSKLLRLLAPALLALLGSAALQDAPGRDPEATEAGRASYLGREIARTMHWTGAEWLMRASREDEENSALLLAQLALEPGDVACDFGCGNGFYTLPMAAAVGAEGEVWAVDIQPEMLELLGERLAEAGVENVRPALGTVRDPRLPERSCDAIVQIDVYHELSHPVTTLGRLRAALAEGGELILVEFRLEDPEVPIKRRHKMTKAQMLLEMAANGFRFAREFDGLPWQHLVAFERDPAWPRAEGQALAEGIAVAEGFARAWRDGDLREVGGYLGERVRTRRGAGADATVESTTARAWLERWQEIRASAGEAFWAAGYGAAEATAVALLPEREGAGAAARVELRLRQGENAQRWVFERDAEGRWPLVEERIERTWVTPR